MQIYEPTAAERAHVDRRMAERFQGLASAYQTRNQVLGRRSTIGCVALEITQRCNLDCTLCYLSDYSEAVPDPPLEELYAKLDRIKDKFGVQTNVQITGGDPTLRKREELVAIVRYAARIGLYPALFTNGIKMSREMLKELADVGLVDVAMHVDITQERKGYASEMALCEVRDRYLERAQGLGLSLIFNTTVCDENVHEVPDLVRYFVSRAGELGMASFQMQAETGRGYLRKKGPALTKQLMRDLIDEGCGKRLSWDALLIGHPQCHNIAYTIVSGGKVIDLFDDQEVLERWLKDFGQVQADRARPVRTGLNVLRHTMTEQPAWLAYGGRWVLHKLAQVAPPALLQAVKERRLPQVAKLSFFIQNFQDAEALDADRIQHCSFHVATRDGTISMCEHNARRDDYIIPPNLVRGVDIRKKRPPIAQVLRPEAQPDQQGDAT
jgi:hypothetical protein